MEVFLNANIHLKNKKLQGFEKLKRDVSLNINPSYKLFCTLQTRSLTSMVNGQIK